MNKSEFSILSVSLISVILSGCYTSPAPRVPKADWTNAKGPAVAGLSDASFFETIVSDEVLSAIISNFSKSMDEDKNFKKNYDALLAALKARDPEKRDILPVVVFDEIKFPAADNFSIRQMKNLRFQIMSKYRGEGRFDVKEDVAAEVLSYMDASTSSELDNDEALTWGKSHRVPEYFFKMHLSKQIDMSGLVYKLRAELYCVSPLTGRAGLVDWTDMATFR